MDPNNPNPTQPTPPAQPPNPPLAAQPPTSPAVTPVAPGVRPLKRRRLSQPVWGGIIVFILLAGAAAYYFGYYNNPSVVYKQSLNNTAKGYDKLVAHWDDQTKRDDKGYHGTGSFSYKSKSYSTDGDMAFKGDVKNTQLTFDVGLGTTRLEADIRALASQGDNPDVYIKAKGVTGIGALLGNPALDTSLAKINDTWVVVDHTLLDSLVPATSREPTKPPTGEQVLDAARAVSQPNQDYLFATDDKAVLKIVKKHGAETVDGHQTHHYTARLDKANTKQYLKAVQAAVKSSKLQKWLKDNGYDGMVEQQFEDAQKSADDIKSDDTFELWIEAKQRLIYKVRFNSDNPAATYVDLGLDYKGGDTFPFFLSGQSKDGKATTTFSLVATVNSQNDDTDLKLDVKTGGDNAGTFSAKFKLTPSKGTIKISKPTGAKPLAEVLNELGLGNYLTLLQGAQSSAVPPGQLPTAGELPPGFDPSLLQ